MAPVEPIEEIKALTSGLAHDLGAPLRHISAFGQLLQEDVGAAAGGAVAPERHEEWMVYTERIIAAAARAQSLLDDLVARSNALTEAAQPSGPSATITPSRSA
ncbi:MAG: hypothetical protein DHS20C19_03450 [Acidimicrobiales bacterium]|nr:MAG: hypothetical protein DHS20C19_03450 [Acidimicrobiales bacterium]